MGSVQITGTRKAESSISAMTDVEHDFMRDLRRLFREYDVSLTVEEGEWYIEDGQDIQLSLDTIKEELEP